ncbi:MAG: hypothetical protein M3R24_31150 [Chloroflexota bacterium]|nr:hypothetical protein [Chloroflexota bacterium]
MEQLSTEQAYKAMFLFLDKYYQETSSNDVGSLLSGMALLADGMPVDSAYAHEWQECVAQVLRGDAEDIVTLKLTK